MGLRLRCGLIVLQAAIGGGFQRACRMRRLGLDIERAVLLGRALGVLAGPRAVLSMDTLRPELAVFCGLEHLSR